MPGDAVAHCVEHADERHDDQEHRDEDDSEEGLAGAPVTKERRIEKRLAPLPNDEHVERERQRYQAESLKQLPEVLPAADIFLLPYPNKIVNVGRWPNKIGDYMAVGRPTVANPVGELIDLFAKYQIGRLADETPEAMAEAALALLANPQEAERIGLQARRIAETDLNWTSQIARLEAWYRDIIQKRQASLGGVPVQAGAA